ncbi:MAG: glycosyltransferase [Deltaproteobacteria bacterium]|nr:glycosyltransferase [Deltaproteobacteria bacterium]
MHRIAMISLHSCPLAALGGKETGGMNVYIRELSRELAKEGFLIDIFTRSQNASIPQVVNLNESVRVIHLKAGPEAPYDKNQVWSHLPEFLDAMERFSYKEGIDYNLIHSHYWLSGWVGVRLSSKWNIPHLTMFHTMAYFKNKVLSPLGKSEPPLRSQVETQLVKHSDHIVVSSHREKVEMVWSYNASSEKISVIPCGVDPDLFIPRDALQSKVHLNLHPKRFILFVGRIDPVKGIDTLLKAMALVKNKLTNGKGVNLLIIGGDIDNSDYSKDSELQRLKQLTERLDLKNSVTFLGAQRQDQLPYFYSASELCVLPSRYESFGMVALEAMACGTPVIASKVGGLTSFIQDEITGFLVPEEDENSLAEKILILLNNPSLKDRLGIKARSRARGFSWQSIARQIISLYQHLLDERDNDSKEQVDPSFLATESNHAALNT